MPQSPAARSRRHHQTPSPRDRSKRARPSGGHASPEALPVRRMWAPRETAPTAESLEAHSHRRPLGETAHMRTETARRSHLRTAACGPPCSRRARCIPYGRSVLAELHPQNDRRPSSSGWARKRSAKDRPTGRTASGARPPGCHACSVRIPQRSRRRRPFRRARRRSGTPGRGGPSPPGRGAADAPRRRGLGSCCCRSKGALAAWTRRGLQPFLKGVTSHRAALQVLDLRIPRR